MGIWLCEQNFRNFWIRNESVRAEIGQILRTHTRGSISSKDIMFLSSLMSELNDRINISDSESSIFTRHVC